VCSEGCAGRAVQLGLDPMLNAADVALRSGPASWGEQIMIGGLPDFGLLYLLVKGRLVDPTLAPQLLEMDLVEVNALTLKLGEAIQTAANTGKPSNLSADKILDQVFGMKPGDILP